MAQNIIDQVTVNKQRAYALQDGVRWYTDYIILLTNVRCNTKSQLDRMNDSSVCVKSAD